MPEQHGLSRVLNPTGFVPATAFQLDNSFDIKPGEIRIKLERIHIEWNHFMQICKSCGYDENKIKGKILGTVERHGKIYNPFSHSGGAVLGTIDAIASNLPSSDILQTGNRICYLAPLNSVPVHIDHFISIDYNYGQIVCTGYAILFDPEQIIPVPLDLGSDYTLAVLNEGGSLYTVHNMALKAEGGNVAIFARNEHTALFYAAALKFNNMYNYNITCVMDDASSNFFTHDETRDFLNPFVRKTSFVDIHDPLQALKQLQTDPVLRNTDHIILAEDIPGADTLAIMLVRPEGDVYFTIAETHYSDAQVVADSLGKSVNLYAFTDYINSYSSDILELVRELRPFIKKIDSCFQNRIANASFKPDKPESIFLSSSNGKENVFVYQSPVTKNMVEDVLNVAKFDCNVIIQGETGVGKEQVLSLIHQNSDRADKPCIKINCATIQENLAESEFFGYESGAFTGAQASGKIGYFEMANNGILFLDEIGTLSLNMQSKLLRVLQENQFYRVGGTNQINVDVRVICANNVPLQDIVEKGEFREDLYYRLNICKINVPPLRERREDIKCLSEAFLAHCNRKYKVEKELSDGALRAMYNYSWPGNVRELENIIHRLIISTKGNIIDTEDVDLIINEAFYKDKTDPIREIIHNGDAIDFHQYIDEQEKKIIEYALKKEGTTRKAADLIGLPQTTFARKKLKYNL